VIRFLPVLCLLVLYSASALAETITLKLWAVAASQEGREERYFDPGLEAIQGAVSDLNFDTFRKIQVDQKRLETDNETRVPLNSTYTLCLKPLTRDAEGRIRMEIRVEMQPKEPGSRVLNVISTRMALPPNKMAKLGGAKLEKGELVVVLQASG
jgi:hypothetical protein